MERFIKTLSLADLNLINLRKSQETILINVNFLLKYVKWTLVFDLSLVIYFKFSLFIFKTLKYLVQICPIPAHNCFLKTH